MIYITGDIHGDIDIRKPTNQNFPQQRLMTKMIILLSAETLVYFGRIHFSEHYWLRRNIDNFLTMLVRKPISMK